MYLPFSLLERFVRSHDSHLKNRTFYFPLNLFVHLHSQTGARELLDDSLFSSTDEDDGISVAGSAARE